MTRGREEGELLAVRRIHVAGERRPEGGGELLEVLLLPSVARLQGNRELLGDLPLHIAEQCRDLVFEGGVIAQHPMARVVNVGNADMHYVRHDRHDRQIPAREGAVALGHAQAAVRLAIAGGRK